jgi:hypothetical protein
MIRKIALSLAVVMLMSVIVPKAKSDSFTEAVKEIYFIDPILVNGEPDPTATVEYSASEIAFVTPTYHIGITWQALQAISVFAFGNPDAQIFTWDDSMSLIGCSWESVCDGAVSFDDSGVIGNGTLYSTPHLGIMTIDSLTIATPEPSGVLLLGTGFVGLMGLFHRKVGIRAIR